MEDIKKHKTNLILAIIAMAFVYGGDIIYASNLRGWNEWVYKTTPTTTYSVGELICQSGDIICALLTAIIVKRATVLIWWSRPITTFIVETYVTSLFFTIFSNPFEVNWNRISWLIASFVMFLISFYLHKKYKFIRNIKLF